MHTLRPLPSALLSLGVLCALAPWGHAYAAKPHKHAHGAHHKARVEHAAPPRAADVNKQLPPKQAPADEAVEAVEAVEPVEAATATPAEVGGAAAASDAAAKPTLSLYDRAIVLLGHLHAAVVHLPIAWVLLWVLFDLLGLWLGQTQLLAAGPWLGALATLSFAPAVVSGLLRFDELSHAAADPHTMDPALLHRNLMYLALGLCASSYLARKKALTDQRTAVRIAYTLLLVACIVVVGLSAHIGGALVYGDEFLQL